MLTKDTRIKFKRTIELTIELHEIDNVKATLRIINEDLIFHSDDVYLDNDTIEYILKKVKERVNINIDDIELIEYIKMAYANVLTTEYQDKAYDYMTEKIKEAINSVDLSFDYEFIEVCFDSIVIEVKADRKKLREELIEENKKWLDEHEAKMEYYEKYGVMQNEYYSLEHVLERRITDAIKNLVYILEHFDERGCEAYVSNLDDVVEEVIELLRCDGVLTCDVTN